MINFLLKSRRSKLLLTNWIGLFHLQGKIYIWNKCWKIYDNSVFLYHVEESILKIILFLLTNLNTPKLEGCCWYIFLLEYTINIASHKMIKGYIPFHFTILLMIVRIAAPNIWMFSISIFDKLWLKTSRKKYMAFSVHTSPVKCSNSSLFENVVPAFADFYWKKNKFSKMFTHIRFLWVTYSPIQLSNVLWSDFF